MCYPPVAEQDLPWARAQGSAVLSRFSSVSELIAVRLLSNLKAYLKTDYIKQITRMSHVTSATAALIADSSYCLVLPGAGKHVDF